MAAVDLNSLMQQLGSKALRQALAFYDTGLNGVAIKIGDEQFPRKGELSLISFHGAADGILAIQASRDVLSRSIPATEIEHELDEWRRELTNRIMGVFKGQLGTYGVAVEISIPMTCIDPSALTAPAALLGPATAFRLKNGGQELTAFLTFQLAPGVTVSAEPNHEALAGKPGQMLTF